MGCRDKTFKCMTCGLGPLCTGKLKRWIHFNKWSLRWQLVGSVTLFLGLLQIVMQGITQWNFAFLFEKIADQYDNQIDDQNKQNFIQQAENIEESICNLMHVWNFTLNKMKAIILESTLDQSDYFGAYPIVWDKTEVATYEELIASDTP